MMPTIDACSTNRYDAIVVGAGPAGCAASYYLARRGLRILMLDKDRFPRDKVCGDGISSLSAYLLKRMGFYETAIRHDPWAVPGLIMTSPNGTVLKTDIPRDEPYASPGFIFPRKEFDALLLDHIRAIDAVDVLEKVKVTDLIFENGTCIGVKGTHNSISYDFKGTFIVGADGVHSIIARRISCFNDQGAHRAFGIRAYFTGVENLSHAIELHYEGAILPAYGWIFPIDATTANVGVAVYTRFKSPKNIAGMFETFVDTNKHAQVKLKNATMKAGTLKGFPLACGSVPMNRSRGTIVLTGDAGSFVDTLTGEGISNALTSGELAAAAIHEAIMAGEPQRAGAAYERLWRNHFYWNDFKLGYYLQPFMNKKPLLNYFTRKAAANHSLGRRLSGVISHVLPKKRILF